MPPLSRPTPPSHPGAPRPIPEVHPGAPRPIPDTHPGAPRPIPSAQAKPHDLPLGNTLGFHRGQYSIFVLSHVCDTVHWR